MRRVYLDTIGLLALWNGRDQWHESAVKAFDLVTAAGVEFWTSSYVLLECGNTAARMPFRREVVELRQHLLSDGKLIEPTEDDLSRAWEAYARGTPGEAGIVDHVSFEVMRRLGISEAFTNDKHFAAAGFQKLF
jgi:predicted nucleic acid-binding protein